MYEYRVKQVLRVVDGDTIDVDIDLGFDISFTSRVRLAGIDTPESRTTDKKEKVSNLLEIMPPPLFTALNLAVYEIKNG